jgi:hypothetical protein
MNLNCRCLFAPCRPPSQLAPHPVSRPRLRTFLPFDAFSTISRGAPAQLSEPNFAQSMSFPPNASQTGAGRSTALNGVVRAVTIPFERPDVVRSYSQRQSQLCAPIQIHPFQQQPADQPPVVPVPSFTLSTEDSFDAELSHQTPTSTRATVKLPPVKYRRRPSTFKYTKGVLMVNPPDETDDSAGNQFGGWECLKRNELHEQLSLRGVHNFKNR